MYLIDICIASCNTQPRRRARRWQSLPRVTCSGTRARPPHAVDLASETCLGSVRVFSRLPFPLDRRSKNTRAAPATLDTAAPPPPASALKKSEANRAREPTSSNLGVQTQTTNRRRSGRNLQQHVDSEKKGTVLFEAKSRVLLTLEARRGQHARAADKDRQN